MGRVLMFVPPVLFAALVLLFGAGMFRDNPDDLPSAFVGRPAPGVPVEGLPGTPALTEADLRSGDVTIVNFWATWCPPCRAEHPTLVRLAGEGVRVAGINMMDDADKAVEFLAQEGNPFFAVGSDPKGRVRLDWGVTAPPETFIIAGDGTVAYKFIGPLIGTDFETRFMPELAKALAQSQGN